MVVERVFVDAFSSSSPRRDPILVEDRSLILERVDILLLFFFFFFAADLTAMMGSSLKGPGLSAAFSFFVCVCVWRAICIERVFLRDVYRARF